MYIKRNKNLSEENVFNATGAIRESRKIISEKKNSGVNFVSRARFADARGMFISWHNDKLHSSARGCAAGASAVRYISKRYHTLKRRGEAKRKFS